MDSKKWEMVCKRKGSEVVRTAKKTGFTKSLIASYKKVKTWLKEPARWSPFLSVIKQIYSVISVISTLTIFTAFILFLIGKVGLASSSDDDLIMRDIKKQIPDNLMITSITPQDIHGFGNDSLIVLASEYGRDVKGSANQLLVFDKVENDVLNRVYNLFGYGSNYKLTYTFSLASDSDDSSYLLGYSLELLDIVELTGDTSKEIVVKFMSIPAGTSGYYQIGIFSYSFEKHDYYLVGTYPPVDGYQLDPERYFWNTPAPTVLHSETANQYNFYDPSERFALEYGTYDDNDFYLKHTDGSILLVRTQMIWGESHVEPHRHVISVFTPQYDREKDELEWNVIFSKETKEYTRYCTEEFVIEFLKENDRYDIIGYLP